MFQLEDEERVGAPCRVLEKVLQNAAVWLAPSYQHRPKSLLGDMLKGLVHSACLARVVSWFAFVATIFMAHENGDEQKQAKR